MKEIGIAWMRILIVCTIYAAALAIAFYLGMMVGAIN